MEIKSKPEFLEKQQKHLMSKEMGHTMVLAIQASSVTF